MATWWDVGRIHGFIKSMAQVDGGIAIATQRAIFLLKDGKLSKLEFDLTFDPKQEETYLVEAIRQEMKEESNG